MLLSFCPLLLKGTSKYKKDCHLNQERTFLLAGYRKRHKKIADNLPAIEDVSGAP